MGKLRNNRYVTLHPQLVEQLAAWTAANLGHIRDHRRLIADHRGPIDRTRAGAWSGASHEEQASEHTHISYATRWRLRLINRGMRWRLGGPTGFSRLNSYERRWLCVYPFGPILP